MKDLDAQNGSNAPMNDIEQQKMRDRERHQYDEIQDACAIPPEELAMAQLREQLDDEHDPDQVQFAQEVFAVNSINEGLQLQL